MTTQINKWRIFCETENIWTYKWLDANENTPTYCFNNNTHTVNTSSSSIIDILDSKEVIIKEENTKTQGNFRTEGFKLPIPAQNEYKPLVSFDYNLNLLAVWFNVNTENIGDKITIAFQPPYTGTIVANINEPTYTVQVDLVTANILNIGYNILIKRNSDDYIEDVGEVITLNKSTGVLTTNKEITNTFSIGDLVYLQIVGIKNLYLSSLGRHSIGTSKLGATYIVKNGVFQCYYTNNTPASTKNFYYELEYLY